MLFTRSTGPTASTVRLIGLLLIGWSVLTAGPVSRHPAGAASRGTIVAVAFVACVLAWLSWMRRPANDGVAPELWTLAAAGGILCGAAPNSAASAFVFVAVASAGIRTDLSRAFVVGGVGALALAGSVLVYDGSAVSVLAYSLGFVATTLGGANARQTAARAEQAELLLAQTQRSHEEQLRATQLEESTRVAREIHDVLAHALAGLTIQLEATSALVDQGADRDTIKVRLERAQALAREGLHETRRAVGALRREPVAIRSAIAALTDEYRAGGGVVAVSLDGDLDGLPEAPAEAVVRVLQESLTNVRKHAPGARVAVVMRVGPDGEGPAVRLNVDNAAPSSPAPTLAGALAATGGGYGLQGMRERAGQLGGTLTAGPHDDGWQVALRLPAAGSPGLAAAVDATEEDRK